MPHSDAMAGLLADLDTIRRAAQAGVSIKGDVQLEPGDSRPAAALFLGIEGLSGLSHVLTSEQMSALAERTFRIFELTVKSQGGYCDNAVGDAALYVFVGHPDFPPPCEAALIVALKIQQRTRQIAESLKPMGQPIAARIGVSFGEITRPQGGNSESSSAVIGNTVTVAQRLESTAKPGTIHTTIRVLEKAGGIFQHVPVGSLDMKGIGPVVAYEVSGIGRSPVKLRGSFRRLAPLIGRDDVLKQAAEQVEEWLAMRHPASSLDGTTDSALIPGRNRLLLLKGPPAVGKTRVAHELSEMMRERFGASTATAHCVENASLRAFTAELSQVAGINAENLPKRWGELCSHAAQAVGEHYAERARRHLPLLALVLGCKEVDTSGIRHADHAGFSLGCRLAARACCELAAHYTGKPVVVVIEDLQWMGALTDVVSDLLVNARLPQPLVVIATAHPEYERNGAVPGDGQVRVFEIDPLGAANGKALLDSILPGLQLPQHLEAELHKKAAGLPYYYEEFARMLAQSGWLEERNGGYALSRDLPALELPEDIQMLILWRLDQLPRELKEVIMRASVLGWSFVPGLLAEVDRRLGLDSPGHTDSLLATLTSHHVLERSPADRYFFEHIFARDAAYSGLLWVNRVILHSLAADVLEEIVIPGTAEEWAILAEVVNHLEACGRYLDAHQKCCHLLGLMVATGNQTDWDKYEARSHRLWKLARDAEPGLPTVSSKYLGALGISHRLKGRMDEAKACLEQELAASRDADDLEQEGRALFRLAVVHAEEGRMDEARSCCEMSLAVAREIGDRREEGRVLANLGLLNYLQGRMDEDARCFEQALALARECGDRRNEATSLGNLGVLHHEQGRFVEAMKCYEASLAIAREVGNRRLEGALFANMGTLHKEQGRTDEAILCSKHSLAIERETGDIRREGMALRDLGEIELLEGRMGEARKLYEQSLAIAHRLGEHGIEGEDLGALGDLKRQSGDLDGARVALEESTRLLKEADDTLLLGWTHCYWVHYHLAVGDVEAAQASVADAKRCADDIDAGPDSELGKDIAEARLAIVEYKQKHGKAT